MAATAIIKNVRRASQLSQKALSERSGVAGSSLSQIENGKRIPTVDTVERLLTSMGQTLIAIPSLRADAATIAGLIARAERSGDKKAALRHFIQLSDNLASEHAEIRFALTISEPALTGVRHWDAAIAALVAYRLGQEDLPVPRWATDSTRRSGKFWTLTAGTYVVPVSLERVPSEFVERGILVDAATLESV